MTSAGRTWPMFAHRKALFSWLLLLPCLDDLLISKRWWYWAVVDRQVLGFIWKTDHGKTKLDNMYTDSRYRYPGFLAICTVSVWILLLRISQILVSECSTADHREVEEWKWITIDDCQPTWLKRVTPASAPADATKRLFDFTPLSPYIYRDSNKNYYATAVCM